MVWLIITPMRWGFRKDLPNWFLCSGTMRFPDPMCLFPIPTAFPRPNSWKEPFSAPHPVPLFELGRCAEPCVPMPAPIPSACFSIRSSLFNFHFPKSPQGLFFILHMDVNVLTMYFSVLDPCRSPLLELKKTACGIPRQIDSKAPLCYHQTK